MRRNTDSIHRWNAAVAKAEEVRRTSPLANGNLILFDNIYPLDDSAIQEITPDGVCPFLGQEAWISAQGRFDPCCAPDAQRRTLGEFGNVEDTPLLDIWQGESYRSLLANYRNRSLCAKCNMRKPHQDKQ